jgi:hypothetical protein
MSRYLLHDSAERLVRAMLGVINLPREELYAEAFRQLVPIVMEELQILEIRRAREEQRLGGGGGNGRRISEGEGA